MSTWQPAPPTTTPAPVHCLLILTQPEFTLHKPEPEDCELVVVALRDHCRLQLTFRQFLLAESAGCASEHLAVDGRRFCGTQPAGQTGQTQ